LHIHAPRKEGFIRPIERRIAGIHMPAGIPGIALAGKSYRECAKCWEWPPAANPDELVNRGNESRRVCRRAKWRIEVAAQPDDRMGPGRAVELVTSSVTP